ncbi:MAG TPA: hypothetical protein VLK33_09005, partial [Terriglobales bacterium]|nr:hypothetical protein [Terriglobales bacterium]
MQWIGSNGFLMMYRDFRTVWLSGRFGSGKTATALALSSWLTGNAYSSIVCANIPIYGAEFPPPIPLTDAALIIDEAHLYLDAWRDVRRYTAFLRKVNLRLAMPSIYPPHARLRMLELQRIYNWYNMSIPMWQYKWRVNAGMFSESGWAFLWKPHEI